MIFKKSFFFKEFKVEINLSNLQYQNKNIFIFGSAIYHDFSKLNKKNIKNKAKELTGYFFIIVVNKDSIECITDVAANNRVYYYNNKKNLKIFDDQTFDSSLKYKVKIIDKNYFNFFLEKNFTPGDETYFKNIKKFQPCTYYNISNKLHLGKKIYFPNNINKPNIRSCKKEINTYFKNQFKNIRNEKVILLFSGGLDSLFLFKMLKLNNIEFSCAYFYSFPSSFETEHYKKKVKGICNEEDIFLDLIEVNTKKLLPILKFIRSKMQFNYHLSLLFLRGVQSLKKRYGKNILLISGQSCDSILSFGPSQLTKANFVARFLNIYPFNFISKLMVSVLNMKFNKDLRNPRTNINFYESFFFNFFYYPLIYSTNFKKKDIITSIINNIGHIKDKYSKMLFLKSFGFLQGPDNMVLIKSANEFGINKVYYPFASYKFISIISKYYNFKLDLFYPKYILKVICKKYIYLNPFRRTFNIYLSHIDNKLKKKYINHLMKKYEIKN